MIRATKQHVTLTDAEHEILALRSQGFNNAEVADQRGVKITTVRTQLRAAYTKLGANDITGALYAYRRLSA